MYRVFFAISLALVVIRGFAQPYAVGHTTAVMFDALRTRDVPVELHYPANVAGEGVPAVAGAFPVLVMGHGFVMDVNAYGNIVDAFVPRGYIVALPSTEAGFLPDHALFAGDLAFLASAVQQLGADGSSPLFGAVSTASAILGHSMGGGASMLAAAGNTAIAAVVNFAAAETDPSAIAAAPAIVAPTLMFAASEDCVTPIGDHQQPMYDALTTDCRALITITGGGHCYFANTNFNCSFGEFTCGPDLTITREEQQDVAADLALLWLDHFVKGDASALIAFNDSIATTARAVCQSSCLSTQVTVSPGVAHEPWYDAGSNVMRGTAPGEPITFSDVAGRTVRVIVSGPDGQAVLGDLPSGIHFWRTRSAQGMQRSGRCLVP